MELMPNTTHKLHPQGNMDEVSRPLANKRANNSDMYSTFKDDVDCGDEIGQFDVADAIEQVGFGPFQVFVGVVAGLAWVADGIEIMVVSILGPVLLCEWDISVYQEALLTTFVFLGLLLGSPVFGWFADKFGRRHALVASSLWISIFGALSALATNLYALYILRLLVGIGVGGCPQVITYFAEFLPNAYRGRSLVLAAIFFSLGGSLTAISAAFILIPYGWRWWLGACAIPSIVFVGLCVVFGYCLDWLPRSPHYDLVSNNIANADRTLGRIARWNKGTLPEGTLVSGPNVPRGRICDLWETGLRVTSLILTALWFLVGLSYYGMVLFTTVLLAAGSSCGSDVTVDVDNDTCVILQGTDYVHLSLVSMAEIPGLFITAILIDKIGRKATLIIEYLIYGVTCLALFICMNKNVMTFLVYVLRSIGLSLFEVLLVYTPELYPTEVRALSLGVGAMFCRLATMLAPYVSEVLASESLYYPIGIYAAIGFLSSGVTWLLPVETKDQSLRSHR